MGEKMLMLATNDAGLTEEDRALLRSHGYETIVVADPTGIRPIDATGDGDLLEDAIAAMNECPCGTCRQRFHRATARRLLDRRGGSNVR